jgi:hypothetical protein
VYWEGILPSIITRSGWEEALSFFGVKSLH